MRILRLESAVISELRTVDVPLHGKQYLLVKEVKEVALPLPVAHRDVYSIADIHEREMSKQTRQRRFCGLLVCL